MGSYLEQNYLEGDDDLSADNATVALTPAAGEAAPQNDLIALPGGIIIRRNTLYLIIVTIAIVGLALYLKKRKRSRRDAE